MERSSSYFRIWKVSFVLGIAVLCVYSVWIVVRKNTLRRASQNIAHSLLPSSTPIVGNEERVSSTKEMDSAVYVPPGVSVFILGKQFFDKKPAPSPAVVLPDDHFEEKPAILSPAHLTNTGPYGLNSDWIDTHYHWQDIPPLGNIGRYQALTIVYSTSSVADGCPSVIEFKEPCDYIWAATRADVAVNFEPRTIPALELQAAEPGGFRLIIRNPQTSGLQLAAYIKEKNNHTDHSSLSAKLYPMRASQNKNILLTGQERQHALDDIAANSPDSLRAEIRQGLVEWY